MLSLSSQEEVLDGDNSGEQGGQERGVLSLLRVGGLFVILCVSVPCLYDFPRCFLYMFSSFSFSKSKRAFESIRSDTS